MPLNQDLLPLRDYHKAKRLIWDPQDLSFEQDRQDWQQMSDAERGLVQRTLGLFMAGEAAVTHDLTPLLIALKREGGHFEEEMFLTVQLFEEAKHVELFDAVLAQVIGETGEVGDPTALPGPNYQLLFAELARTLDTLLADSSHIAQARAVATYHLIIEGVLAETAYYGVFKGLRDRELMPGLTMGLELVQRDEARHIAFGLYLLTRLVNEEPSLWSVIESKLSEMLPLAQGVFMEVLGDLLPDIPFGLDLNDLIEYAGRQYTARIAALDRAYQRKEQESLRNM
jgi:ribonucleoside-diphosphate reductase beta chain